MSSRPVFSIVMPTRNRAQFLRFSLQSVLEQSFEDYEIVVSDNNSSDDTPQVVRELADRRVRYVRSDQPLSNPDSSEFALTHARGEYIIFLADDDVMCPELLGKVAEVASPGHAQVTTWERAFYQYGRSSGRKHANTLELCPFTQQITEVDSRSALKRLFAADLGHGFPALVDAAYHCDVITRVKARASRFFPTIPLDISSCIAVLTQVDKYLYIHDALVLYGKHDNNTVYSVYRPQRDQRSASDFSVNRFDHVPLKLSLLLNFLFETLLKMKEVMPEELKDYDISWGSYFLACHNDLVTLEQSGADVSAELQEFDTVLSQQPSQLQDQVREAIDYWASPASRHKSAMRRVIEHSSPLGKLELTLRPGFRQSKNLVIQGKEAGFDNILECARFFNRSLREELARFWLGQRHSLPVNARILLEDPWRIV